MGIDPIACTLLAAASVSRGLRRAVAARPSLPPHPMEGRDPIGSAIATERLRARALNVPDSAIDAQLEMARSQGQSELLALRGLIDGVASGARR